jgi:hypothetical protein
MIGVEWGTSASVLDSDVSLLIRKKSNMNLAEKQTQTLSASFYLIIKTEDKITI